MQDIEGAEIHGIGIAVDGFLQRAEIRQPGLIGDDRFTVDDRVLDLEIPRGLNEPGIFARPVRTGFRIDADILGAANDDLGAIAVELDLVNPVLTLGRLGDQLGLHWRDKRQPRPRSYEPHATAPDSINFERFGSLNAKRPPQLSARRAIGLHQARGGLGGVVCLMHRNPMPAACARPPTGGWHLSARRAYTGAFHSGTSIYHLETLAAAKGFKVEQSSKRPKMYTGPLDSWLDRRHCSAGLGGATWQVRSIRFSTAI